MKCLVTGGAGFIGSHLVDALLKQGHKVVVVDNLSTGVKKNLNQSAIFYKADILGSKVGAIFKREKPEIVFHLAAHIEARESVKNPIFDAKINILGSINILENCRKYGMERVVFISSGGEIYGGAEVIPTPETCPLNPISPYGVAKLAVEKYLYSYCKMYGINSIVLRLANVYGPRQNPNGEAGVVAIFINKMLHNEQPFIHGDGRQTKDYIYIADVVEAIMLVMNKGIKTPVNVATGKETSVRNI